MSHHNTPGTADTADTNRGLITLVKKNFKRSGDPTPPDIVFAAMERVDRKLFLPETEKPHAYQDRPLSIGRPVDNAFFDSTCSQPYIVALMIHLLEVKPGQRVLEVGSGCGYVAAILAELGARVYGVEIHPELVGVSRQNLKAHFGPKQKRVQIVHGNGREGLPEQGPYDRILFSASPPHYFDNRPLIFQLSQGGRVLYPRTKDTEPLYARLERYVRVNGRLLLQDICAPEVCFVPLVMGQ